MKCEVGVANSREALVEVYDERGHVLTVDFSGEAAAARAVEYASWKSAPEILGMTADVLAVADRVLAVGALDPTHSTATFGALADCQKLARWVQAAAAVDRELSMRDTA